LGSKTGHGGIDWGRALVGLGRGAWLGSKTGRGGQPTQYNGLCATPMVAQHMQSIDSSVIVLHIFVINFPKFLFF
jgi:hypothetical protein